MAGSIFIRVRANENKNNYYCVEYRKRAKFFFQKRKICINVKQKCRGTLYFVPTHSWALPSSVAAIAIHETNLCKYIQRFSINPACFLFTEARENQWLLSKKRKQSCKIDYFSPQNTMLNTCPIDIVLVNQSINEQRNGCTPILLVRLHSQLHIPSAWPSF